ncbi:MAG TPA: DUF4349 domain-containing protein [Solirubrobacterales bacterium]
MEPFRDDNELIAELLALRPSPSPTFAATLDERAAAGFPRRSPFPPQRFAPLVAKLRALPPRRIAFSAAAAALVSVAFVTAVVIAGGSGTETGPGPRGNTRGSGVLGDFQPIEGAKPPAAKSEADAGTASAESGRETLFEGEAPAIPDELPTKPSAANASHRDVERSASIVLGAEPGDVSADAARVSEAVHANGGIVLRSSISDGSAGHPGASFQLLIPSTRLDDAMASFAQIDEVRLRNEGSLDITAPTVSLGERLKESEARIEALLGQLAAAETEAEREVVEAELRGERRHHAALRSRLTTLQRRAHFSHVSLRIESRAGSTTPGGWGLDNALHDAGHVLSVAAGVVLIGLAVLAPLALLALIAWLARRIWLRQARDRALG